MDNTYTRADLTDKDSQGNTTLHALVVIADNTTENTDMIERMYDEILIQHNKLHGKKVQLEAIENNQRLTPLKLAAKLGKIGVNMFPLEGFIVFSHRFMLVFFYLSSYQFNLIKTGGDYEFPAV